MDSAEAHLQHHLSDHAAKLVDHAPMHVDRNDFLDALGMLFVEAVGGLEVKLRHQMRIPATDQQLKLRAVRHEFLEEKAIHIIIHDVSDVREAGHAVFCDPLMTFRTNVYVRTRLEIVPYTYRVLHVMGTFFFTGVWQQKYLLQPKVVPFL